MPSPYRCFLISSFQCQSFFSPFFLFLLSARSGHSLREACLCYSQAHSYLVALLFSFLLPLFSLNTPGKFGCVSDIFFFCPADQFLFLLISSQFANLLSLILMSNCLQSNLSVERYAIFGPRFYLKYITEYWHFIQSENDIVDIKKLWNIKANTSELQTSEQCVAEGRGWDS